MWFRSCICVRLGGEGPRYLCAVGVGEHKSFDAAVVGAAVAAGIREKGKIKSAALYVPDLCAGCPCKEAPKVFLRKLQAVLETLLVEINPDNRCAIPAGDFYALGGSVFTVYTTAIEPARRVASGKAQGTARLRSYGVGK